MANGQQNSENSLRVLGWKRYLSRYWRGDARMLSFIFVAAIISVTTFAVLFMSVAAIMVFTVLFGPYNPYVTQINEFANRIAPDIFLSNEPQHIVVVGSLEAENLVVSNVVVMAKVAEDGLGVLTIPRNTLIEIPEGHGTAEIDKAFALGGADLTRRAVAQLTGTEVPYYLLISPEGVREIVDSMGGVEIEVPDAVSGRASSTGSEITLSPGPQTLDGDRVLVYLQGKDLRNEVERAERQRDFLHAMFRQALSPSNLLSNPATLPTVLEHTQTNMGLAEAVQLANRIRALEDSGATIETGTVPGREETAHSEQDDAQDVYWVLDAQELPNVLEKTVH